MSKAIKVRLKADLTKYLPGLVEDTEGITVGMQGIWSRNSDRFVGVHFPGKGTLDVLWKSLEIIDEEFLLESKEKERRFLEEMKGAYDVIKYVGPRGGFKYLSYTYIDSKGIKNHTSNGFRGESEGIIKIFDDYGIAIETRVLS